MRWQLSRLVPRSAPAVLLMLLFAAMAAFAAVSHLVTRFNANQQARARKQYNQGMADQSAGNLNVAVDDFRAALTGDPSNSLYQLSLGRALRDTGDPRRLDEAEAYLRDLWQRTPEDGTINLALARVAARRGSIEDALRYYHNAMYGVWNSDAEAYRRKARLELIDFLLQKNARVAAQPELMALAASLPPNSSMHLQTATLFEQDQDYRDAFSEYEEVLRANDGEAKAMAGAGEAAYHLGRYRTAEKYLRMAIDANPQDESARVLLDSASSILAADPFVRRISDAERDRRVNDAWVTAGARLKACAQLRGQAPQMPSEQASTQPSQIQKSLARGPANSPPAPDSLSALNDQWQEMKPKVPRMRAFGETALPDAIMDLVFQIEQQTAAECGDPQGPDLALLLFSRNRDAADQ